MCICRPRAENNPVQLCARRKTGHHAGGNACFRQWSWRWTFCVVLLIGCLHGQECHCTAEGGDNSLLVKQVCTSRNKVAEFFRRIEYARRERTAEVAPDLAINYTDFRYYAEFSLANANLMSILSAQSNFENHTWHLGNDSFDKVTCDVKGEINFFATRNTLFRIRAFSTLRVDNLFAAGIAFGDGTYHNSEVFFQYHNATISTNRNRFASMGHSIFIPNRTQPIPEWYQLPKDWLYNATLHGAASWLGMPCKALCPNYNSTLLPSMDHCDIPDNMSCPILQRYADNLWVDPYYDNILGFIWMVTYTSPIAIYRNNSVIYLGVTAIDLSLEDIPIDQCSTDFTDGYGGAFADTHMCDPDTTVCQSDHDSVENFLQDGHYNCRCKDGYFNRHDSNSSDAIRASTLVNLMLNVNDSSNFSLCSEFVHDNIQQFRCEKCPNRCRICTSAEDDCRYKNKVEIFIILNIFNGIFAVFVMVITVYIIRRRSETAIRSASWQFLVVILIGCLMGFAGLFVSIEATKATCILFGWMTEIGFALSYGSLLLKSWRIEQIFCDKALVKPKRSTRLKNSHLAIYLAAFVFVFVALLVLETGTGWLTSEEDYTGNDLRERKYYERCTDSSFLYVWFAVQLGVLMSSSYLCFKLRRVLNDYAESREISVIVYATTLIEVFCFISKLFLETTHDIQYIVRSLEIMFLFGVMPAILFLPKVRRVEWPTLEEIALSKTTTRQMRLLRTGSSQALRRRGAVSLDTFHRDSINLSSFSLEVDASTLQQHHRHSIRSGSEQNLFGPRSPLFPALGASSSAKSVSRGNSPLRKDSGNDTLKVTGGFDRQRSQSLALPSPSGISFSYPIQRSPSASFEPLSIGSIAEEGVITPQAPLSPPYDDFSMSDDVTVLPACTTGKRTGNASSLKVEQPDQSCSEPHNMVLAASRMRMRPVSPLAKPRHSSLPDSATKDLNYSSARVQSLRLSGDLSQTRPSITVDYVSL